MSAANNKGPYIGRSKGLAETYDAVGHEVKTNGMYRLTYMLGVCGLCTRQEVELLFAERSATKRTPAAHRLLNSAISKGFVKKRKLGGSKGAVIYGLTHRGCNYLLHVEGLKTNPPTSFATTNTVKHRQVSNLVSLTALQKGGNTFFEHQIRAGAKQFNQAFKKLPDALCIFDDDEDRPKILTWHEVEISYRKKKDCDSLVRLASNLIANPLDYNVINSGGIWEALIVHTNTTLQTNRILTGVIHELQKTEDLKELAHFHYVAKRKDGLDFHIVIEPLYKTGPDHDFDLGNSEIFFPYSAKYGMANGRGLALLPSEPEPLFMPPAGLDLNAVEVLDIARKTKPKRKKPKQVH